MCPKSSRENGSLLIEKTSGEKELFSQKKLRRSLLQVGASKRKVEEVIKLVQEQIFPGISSRAIYRLAFNLLQKEARHLAARYSLKRAIMSLGPTGYPFERVIGSLLEKKGYDTKLDMVLPGSCVSHEVDVVASKKNRRLLVECKFHNREGIKCDIKVALYVYARSLDLKNNSHGSFSEFWLVTNTKFTSDAIDYGKCVGLKMLSWDYPQGKSLKDLIKKEELHPITCLTTLKKTFKKELLHQNIVLCHELVENPILLENLGIKGSQVQRILKEAEELMGI